MSEPNTPTEFVVGLIVDLFVWAVFIAVAVVVAKFVWKALK